MNPYGQNPGQYPQGQRPAPGYPYGAPAPSGPPGPPKPPGGGGRTALIIGLVTVVAIVAVAVAVGIGLVIREQRTTTASPSTFTPNHSAAVVPTTGAAPSADSPGVESDVILPPSSSAPSSGLLPLKLSAGGTGSGRVQVSGLDGTDADSASTLPWQWEGSVSIGDTLTMQVVGSGTVTCAISVDGRDISKREGTGRVQCGIKRSSSP